MKKIFQNASDKIERRIENIRQLCESSTILVQNFNAINLDKLALEDAKTTMEEQNEQLERVAHIKHEEEQEEDEASEEGAENESAAGAGHKDEKSKEEASEVAAE